jgi:death on curing protein
VTFVWVNGLRLTLTNGEAYDFIIAIASGQLNEIETIAETLRRQTEPRPPIPPDPI